MSEVIPIARWAPGGAAATAHRRLDGEAGRRAGRARLAPRRDVAPLRPAPLALVLYASFGAGHEMAARALVKALAARGFRAEALDALSHVGGLGDPLRRAFHFLVARFPAIYGFLFDLLDRIFAWPPAARARHAANRWIHRRFVGEVVRRLPAAVVATHYLPLDALARERRAGRLRASIGVAITDWTPHAFWLDGPADRIYVAGGPAGPAGSRPLAGALAARGVPRHRIAATGIPVDPDIGRLRPRAREAGKPVALVLMGGYGTGALGRVVRSFRDVRGVRLEIVAGRNERARRELERLVGSLRLDAAVHGFVEHGALLRAMAAAAVVVTKPGGLTLAEAASLGRPLVLVGPAVGQELGNARAAVGAGAAVLACGPARAGPEAARLLADPRALAAMGDRARRLAPRGAAEAIAADVARLAPRATAS